MVRKVSAIVCTLVLICALCTTAQASTHTIYENSTISTTYITYFKDIINGTEFGHPYFAFRSGQNSYTLIVCDSYSRNGNIISSSWNVKEYTYYADSNNYNQNYKFSSKQLDYFEIDITDKILYSTIDNYPRLYDERRIAYDDIQTFTLYFAIGCVFIARIFNSGSRRKR